MDALTSILLEEEGDLEDAFLLEILSNSCDARKTFRFQFQELTNEECQKVFRFEKEDIDRPSATSARNT